MLSKIGSIQSIKSCLLFITTFLLIPSAKADTLQPIDFAQAVKLALSANPKITARIAKVEEADAGITQARAKGLPELDLESDAARSDNPLNVFSYKLSQGQASFADFGFAQFNGSDSINTLPTALDSPGYYSNLNTGVVINVPIFSGGENRAKLKRAQSLLKAAQEENQQAKLELTYDVLQAYEGVRATAALVAIARQSLHASDEYVSLTQALNKQSLVLQSDVLFAQTNERSAKTTLQAAIAQNRDQLDTFQILVGRPQSNIVPGAAVYLPLPQRSIEALQASAYLSNAELASLKDLADANQANIGSAKAGYWPEFDLQLRHDWNSPNLGTSMPSNTVMLEMNWSLFNFGSQAGATREAKAEYKEALAEWQSAKDNVRLSIIQTVRALQTTALQRQTSDQNAYQSMEMVNILKKKYGQAVIPFGELAAGQAQLDTAKAQQVMTRYNMLLAQAKLLMLINQLDFSAKQGKL
ncbi:MAG: TolC family protein [Legionellales bacterium]|nr:TolC family protein [Legionellales bacterium]